MDELYFNERTQAFIIIECGSTISPHKHGEFVLRSKSTERLRIIAIAIKLIADELMYSFKADQLRRVFQENEINVPVK